MKLYRSLMRAGRENVNDVYHVYGMAVAYETVGLPGGSAPIRPARSLYPRSLDHERAGTSFLLPACP